MDLNYYPEDTSLKCSRMHLMYVLLMVQMQTELLVYLHIHIPNSVKSLTRKSSILLHRFDNNFVQIHKLLGLTAVEIYFLVCSKLIKRTCTVEI